MLYLWDRNASIWYEVIYLKLIFKFSKFKILNFFFRGNGWNKHIYSEHNVYSYLFYIIYIKNKSLENCNLIEKNIKNSINEN